MDAYEYGELLKTLSTKIENITNIVKPDDLVARLDEIEQMQQDSEFWNDVTNAGKISQEKTKTERILVTFDNAKDAVNDAVDYFEMAKGEGDDETLEMLYEDAQSLQESTNALEVQMMLSGENDANNAIISIHPGAGGTESQDWASMLHRMYLRWAERHDFKIEVLDYQSGDEAGIKDVSFIIKGENAYGYLKVENGIHRLVRISPFDSNAKRHTSFSSVMVSPEMDDDIDIGMPMEDYRRFCAIAPHELKPGIALQSYTDDPDVYIDFVKLRSDKGTLVEQHHLKEKDRHDSRIFLDVFPFITIKKGRFHRILQKGIFVVIKLLNYNHLRQAKMRRWVIRMVNKLHRPEARSGMIVTGGEVADLPSYFDYDTVFPTRNILFEGKEVRAPNKPDHYLTQLFGKSYMILPPEAQRVAHAVMIEVFDVMAISGSGNARSMASGVSKATIPTMAGMVGALSGVFLVTVLNQKVSREVEDLEDNLTTGD